MYISLKMFSPNYGLFDKLIFKFMIIWFRSEKKVISHTEWVLQDMSFHPGQVSNIQYCDYEIIPLCAERYIQNNLRCRVYKKLQKTRKKLLAETGSRIRDRLTYTPKSDINIMSSLV